MLNRGGQGFGVKDFGVRIGFTVQDLRFWGL